ncbi:hypothetical protein NL480_27940, partial [Klebsiella pneumoniae]|nr:hypothetical protein [Klebsiella pneumoniae]
MSVRRRTAPARLGAGVMLAAACVMGPAAANAAPIGGLVPMQGGLCTTPSMTVSSTEVAVGDTV